MATGLEKWPLSRRMYALEEGNGCVSRERRGNILWWIVKAGRDGDV